MMNSKDQIFIVRNRLFERKNIILIFILSIIFLILFTTLTLINFSIANKNAVLNSEDARSYKIYHTSSSSSFDEDTIEKIKQIEHVELVFSDKYQNEKRFVVTDLNNGNSDGVISLKALKKNSDVKIKKGRNIKNNYELICSDTFYPHEIDGKIYKNLFLNSNDIINKKINLFSQNEDLNNKKISLNIVGTYQNKYEEYANTCYTNIETFDELTSKYNGSNITYDEYGNEQLQEPSEYQDYIIRIDSKDNADQVLAELRNMKLNVDRIYYIDTSYLDMLYFIPLFISIIIILITLLIIYNFISKKIINRLNKVGIMKAIGYEDKDIINLNIIENIIIILLSSVISFIIYLITFNSLKYTLLAEVTYGSYILNIPYLVIILSIVIFSFISSLFVKKSYKKTKNLNIQELLTK